MFFFNASFFNSVREGSKSNERRINSNLNEDFHIILGFSLTFHIHPTKKYLGRGSA